MRHKVNDLVIAMTDPANERSQPRSKGGVYQVQAIMYCSGCGTQLVNVAGKHPHEFVGRTRCICGCEIHSKGLWWTRSELFKPLDELTIAELEANEQYELCASLHQ